MARVSNPAMVFGTGILIDTPERGLATEPAPFKLSYDLGASVTSGIWATNVYNRLKGPRFLKQVFTESEQIACQAQTACCIRDDSVLM